MHEDVVELAVRIRRPPGEVRDWWLEFPKLYQAEDSGEQPHRIETLLRTPERVEVLTYWRGPFGRPVKARETLRREGELAWSADVFLMGFSIHDHFEAVPSEGGTLLRIRSSIVPASSFAALLRPLVIGRLKREMERTFLTAARVCEAQAASAPTPAQL